MVTICINNDTIKDIELFVFDKDGTIIDLYTYWYYMIELRAKRLCFFYKLNTLPHKKNLMFVMGVDADKARLRPEGPVGLLPRILVQKAAEDYLLKLDCPNVSAVCWQIFKEVDELSLPLLDKFIRPIEGVIELLRQIKSRGGKIAIATNDNTERAKLAVKFLRIDDLMDLVIGADKVKEPKPDPDALELIGKKLDVSPQHSIMIGDAQPDIQMGIRADFRASIAVCSGLTSREVLSELTPYAIENISKIQIK